jgi:hypothetical protein
MEEDVSRDVLYEVQSRMPERYGSEVFYKWKTVAVCDTLEKAKLELENIAKKFHILLHRIRKKAKDG